MKITFIGGGAHRYVGAARGLLGVDDLSIREIALYDINREREAIIGRFIKKTPEFRANPCKITWNQGLDEALEGSDLVDVVIFVGDALTHELATHACGRHGFICSQQMTPSGAIHALKIGKVVLEMAQRMERLCPDAWLLDFCNPVAVVSGVVNHYTDILCLGICEGYTNHLWDIPRLFGEDKFATDIDVHSAGINHLSFISPGSTYRGRDLYRQLDELLAAGPWTPPEFSAHWPQNMKANMIMGLEQLLIGYQRYGRLMFTTEHDGLASMNVSEVYEQVAARLASLTSADAMKNNEKNRRFRLDGDRRIAALNEIDADGVDWDNPDPANPYLQIKEENLMVLLAQAKAGSPVRVATSVPNNGAIAGFADRSMVEFTQIFEHGKMRPTRKQTLPANLHGYVASFAAHQTLLADAIARDCPQTLFVAMSCYPIHRDTKAFWSMWREIVEISREDITPNLAKVVEYMPSYSASRPKAGTLTSCAQHLEVLAADHTT